MQTQRINITLPNTIQGKHGKFITAAIKEKLPESNLKEQLRKSAKAQKKLAKEIQKDFKYADAEITNKLP